MIIFSNAMHRLGLLGMPRRTMIGASAYIQPEWRSILPLVGIGGTILFISGVLAFVNIIMTWVSSKEPARIEVPIAEALHGAEGTPLILDQWRPWLAITAILIIIAYGPMLVRLIATTPLNVPGLRVW
jgi:cytochrome c oxidase subunit 1